MEAAWKKLQLDTDAEPDGEYLISSLSVNSSLIVYLFNCYFIVEELCEPVEARKMYEQIEEFKVYEPVREKCDIHRRYSFSELSLPITVH